MYPLVIHTSSFSHLLSYNRLEEKVPVRLSRGYTTLTSKNTLYPGVPQTASAATSNLAPSSWQAVLYDSDSPDEGCSGGSRVTLWQTSFIHCLDSCIFIAVEVI